jgi:predicted dehydrogenase
MLRGAIIGFGNVAVHGHVPGWRRRRDVEIVAVTDTRPAQRALLEAHVPGADWRTSAEALLAEPALDFVDICAPPSSHAPLIRAALERGLHVLCEKPLVSAPGELAPLAGLARAKGRVLHTVHNWHHAPIVRRTRELVGQGRIGRVTRVVWETLRTRPAATSGDEDRNWRLDPAIAGGGVLTDHGWHVFYVVQRWIGEAPRTVSARLETRRHAQWPVEDTATVRIAFDGAAAEILLTWAAAARRNWAQLTGTEGTLELRDDTIVLRGKGAEERWPCPPPLSDGSQHPEWFDVVADEFLAALAAPGTGADNLAEASLCVALEHAARASSRAGGRAVPVAGVAV